MSRVPLHQFKNRAFDRDNVKIVVITRAEFEAMRNVGDAVALMREKFGALIMGLAAV
jgi:hypothetical protein